MRLLVEYTLPYLPCFAWNDFVYAMIEPTERVPKSQFRYFVYSIVIIGMRNTGRLPRAFSIDF